jgi:hypothetical protein
MLTGEVSRNMKHCVDESYLVGKLLLENPGISYFS